jgi:hypothetical protein
MLNSIFRGACFRHFYVTSNSFAPLFSVIVYTLELEVVIHISFISYSSLVVRAKRCNEFGTVLDPNLQL